MVAVADGLTCSCGKFTTGDDDDDGGGGDDDNDGGMRMLLGTLKTDDMHDCGDDVTDDDVAARRFSPFVAVCTGSLAVAVPSPPSTIPHSFFGLYTHVGDHIHNNSSQRKRKKGVRVCVG